MAEPVESTDEDDAVAAKNSPEKMADMRTKANTSFLSIIPNPLMG
jgi:hypothetical protein